METLLMASVDVRKRKKNFYVCGLRGITGSVERSALVWDVATGEELEIMRRAAELQSLEKQV